MIYTGIGSRKTPADVLELMKDIGEFMAVRGHTLRSGGADGADKAFEEGAHRVPGAKVEIYLPWNGFNGYWLNQANLSMLAVLEHTQDIEQLCRDTLAMQFDSLGEVEMDPEEEHWNRLSRAARKLHMRNMLQIEGNGRFSHEISQAVICWTPKGQWTGGTASALKLAWRYNIKIQNLAILNTFTAWQNRIKMANSQF